MHSQIECLKSCPAKDNCGNKNFRLNKQCSVQVKNTEKKGFGLFAQNEINKNEFILEFLGEVIDFAEFKKRFDEKSDENLYFAKLDKNMYIDASKYGNVARFVNHSCNPNAVASRWIVPSNRQEQIRLGFFALRKIVKVRQPLFLPLIDY